jgi:hypothetical protein
MYKIYIVMAEAGEYSEREVWVGGAFRSLDKAKKALYSACERRRLFELWSLNNRLFPEPKNKEPGERFWIMETKMGEWNLTLVDSYQFSNAPDP